MAEESPGKAREPVRVPTGYTGWALPDRVRAALLARFVPAYPDVVAHHVTLEFGVSLDTVLPTATAGTVVGVADDGVGVQALVVRIEGTIARPDGAVFHCTWSLDRANGAKPVHANRVIREHGFEPVEPVAIELEPRMFAAH